MSMSNTEKTLKDIRRNTRRKFSMEEKIRIVLDGLRGESSIAELCRREGINPNPPSLKASLEPDTGLGSLFSRRGGAGSARTDPQRVALAYHRYTRLLRV
jgi:hypothetical protein